MDVKNWFGFSIFEAAEKNCHASRLELVYRTEITDSCLCENFNFRLMFST